MRVFTVRINLPLTSQQKGNDQAIVSKALRQVAERVENGYGLGHIFDENGGIIGDYRVEIE